MYVSLNWLKKFIDIPKGVTPEELAKTLTLKTAETEGVSKGNELLENVVVAFVKELKPHPNADKLRLVKISIGPSTGNKGPRDIEVVCGGANLREGMYVAYAPSGCKVKWHGQGDPVILEKVKIRGIESDGMICTSDEIGLEKPTSEGPEDILDLSSMKPAPGTLMTEVLGLDDSIIEFDNKALTHRADLWGTYGVAREIAAIYKLPLKKFEPKPKIPTKGEAIKVTIENYALCHRYCGVIIKNIKVQPSPGWMQKLLKATDHTCYNNIVDVTNFVSEEIGKPIHAFDRKFVKDEIIVRNAKKGEIIRALDGKPYKLDDEMLVIADKEKAIAIGGIIGGNNSSVRDATTEIIIESAAFYGGNIRKTSTKLGLRTDAVQKFEKELDPTLPLISMLRAIELILEVSPGAVVAGPITDVKKFDEKLKTVELSVERTCSKIGIKISKKEITDILKNLHFDVKPKPQKIDILLVTIPSFRAQKDVNTEDDLVEEIARIYGYDEIPAVLPTLPTRIPREHEERIAKHNLRRLLSLGLGFNEILTYSFYSKTDLEKCHIKEDGHFQVENYLSEDQTHMRISLIPNMLSKAALNAKYQDAFKIFEIGRTYKDIGEYFPLEEKWIGGIVGDKDKKAGDKPFLEAKGAVEEVLKYMKIPFYKLVKGTHAPYGHPIKSATFMSPRGETLATIFALHPSTAKLYDLDKIAVAGFEINLSLLVKSEKRTIKFKELNKFPETTFDVSVIIDEKKEIADIEAAIARADKHLIQNIKLFDFYKGENIDPGRKAVAFKITLSSSDRTLTDLEMQNVQKKVFDNLKALGGVVRGA